MICYIVFFCTGEYEDYKESVIKVFGSKENAEKFAQELRNKLDDLGCHSRGNNSCCESKDHYDIEFEGNQIDYTGAWIAVSSPYSFEN